MTENLIYDNDIVSTKDFSLPQLKQIITTAKKLKEKRHNDLLKNKIIAHCFFEPSTRTRLSFETATVKLGGHVIGFSGDDNLSVKKGETLHDTIRIISAYADLIILRHSKEGAARMAASITDKPLINAGDGANQHPTQALIDLFTIDECQGGLNGLKIALVGDLKYSRTIHSFADICMHYDVRLFLVAPDVLTLPEVICDVLKKKGVRFSFHQTLEEVIPKVDILYMTRIQQERVNPLLRTSQSKFHSEDQSIPKQFILTPEMLLTAKSNLKIMHPLPRVNEINVAIDQTPYAHYFEQAANGVYVRQALLTLLLNKELP